MDDQQFAGAVDRALGELRIPLADCTNADIGGAVVAAVPIRLVDGVDANYELALLVADRLGQMRDRARVKVPSPLDPRMASRRAASR